MSRPDFDEHSTSEDVSQLFQEQIRGKNVLITGVTMDSLGSEVVRVLAPFANLIWVAGRNKERLQKAIAPVIEKHSDARIRLVILVLPSLASVHEAARIISNENEPIHVLFNNAAVPQSETLVRTEDGFEAQFGGNHLGHFLLTKLLLPRLRDAAEGSFAPRVVSLTSAAHWRSGIRWDDPNFELRPEEYDPYVVYGETKMANILFAREFAKRFAAKGILAFAVHPGAIWTNGSRAIPMEHLQKHNMARADGSMNNAIYWKTIGEGTAGHIIAAFDPSLEAHSGAYLVDGQVANHKLAPHASSDENAKKLWTLSEELLAKWLV